MQRAYKCLSQAEFVNRNYKLIPIRDEDKYTILKWRNEQIDILRQKETLTEEKQELYFRNIVDKLFEQEKPDQLLFSFLEDDILIGYGGLVHIDWESKNAEVSFLSATERNLSETIFRIDFENYLSIISSIAFEFLKFLKIHTTVYDISQRDVYRKALGSFRFVQEATLKDHILINGKMESLVIYSFFNKK